MNTREQSAAIKKTVVENATRELVLVHTGKLVELFVYAIRYRTKIHLHERLGVRFEFLVSDKEVKSLRCKDFSYVFLSRFSQFCAKKNLEICCRCIPSLIFLPYPLIFPKLHLQSGALFYGHYWQYLPILVYFLLLSEGIRSHIRTYYPDIVGIKVKSVIIGFVFMFYDSFLRYFESMPSQFKVLYQYQFLKNGVAAHYVDAGYICQKCDCYKIGTSLLERITDMSALNKNAAHRLKRSI